MEESEEKGIPDGGVLVGVESQKKQGGQLQK